MTIITRDELTWENMCPFSEMESQRKFAAEHYKIKPFHRIQKLGTNVVPT